MKNRIRTNFNKKFRRKYPRRTMMLGNGQGTVKVPGVPNAVYARPLNGGPPIVIWNYSGASPLNDIPVVVGEDDINIGLQQVLAVRYYPASNLPAGVGVAAHGSTHTYGNGDPVWIYSRQILNCLAYIDTGFTVKVWAGDMYVAGALVHVMGQSIDLTAYVPAAGACYALLAIDTAGAVVVRVGAVRPSLAGLYYSDVPYPPGGTSPIAAVRLVAGQSSLADDYPTGDLIDLRFQSAQPTIDLADHGALEEEQDLFWMKHLTGEL